MIDLHNSDRCIFRLHADVYFHFFHDNWRRHINIYRHPLVFDWNYLYFDNLCLCGGILSSECPRAKGSLFLVLTPFTSYDLYRSFSDLVELLIT